MQEEEKLVQDILNGNARRFEQLVRQYERLVIHVVSRVIRQEEDLQDVCQDVFIKIYRNLHSFDFRSKLSTWIAQVSYHTALNHLRKNKNSFRFVDRDNTAEWENEAKADATPEELLIKKDAKAYVHYVIKQLNVSYRTVLTLYFLEEFSYAEIAEITDLPLGTIKSHLSRGKLLLKEKLERYLEAG